MGALIAGLLGLGGKVLDKVLPNKEKAQDNDHAENMAKQEVNKTMAAHASIFVAGARAFILWVCGFAFAYSMVAQPLLEAFGINAPKVNLSDAIKVMFYLT